MYIRKVNSKYYIRKGSKFEKVNGIRINRGNLELFLHRFKNKFFVISEVRSGLRISKIHPSSKKAVEYLDHLLESKGENLINRKIEQKIGRNFLSPRFRFIVNPCRNVETI